MNDEKEQIKNFKLCYIDRDTAYFTTRDLDKQWGDDWNDAPYEHNAGTPYGPTIYNYINGENIKCEEDWNEDGTPKWELYHLKFDCWRLETPAAKHYNSPYSVQMINAGAIAWLSGYNKDYTPIAIQAGASIEEFKHKVESAGGLIYILEE